MYVYIYNNLQPPTSNSLNCVYGLNSTTILHIIHFFILFLFLFLFLFLVSHNNNNTFGDAQLVSDFFEVGDWIEVDEDPAPWPFPDINNIPPAPVYYTSTQMLMPLLPNSTRDIEFGFGATNTFFHHQENNTTNREESSSKDKEKEELGKKEKKEKEKVAFKTKSEVEVLDDGFKWRKYGKKMVKNSPNPR